MDEQCLMTLLFADDQVLLGTDEYCVDLIFRKLKEEYKYDAWSLNIDKTE